MRTKQLLLIAIALLVSIGVRATNGNWSGSGTQSSPWEIADLKDLQKLATDVNATTDPLTTYSGKYFKLTTNIDCGSWTPIGGNGTQSNKFCGTFDGGGHTVTYTIGSTTNSKQGLFGSIGEGGEVKNLNVKGSISSSSFSCGGVVGFCNGIISNCYSAVNITSSLNGSAKIGGIAGECGTTATINFCSASGTITKTGVGEGNTNKGGVGGIVGNVKGTTVSNCTFTGKVSAPTENSNNSYLNIGMIAGFLNNSPTFNSCSYYSTNAGSYKGLGSTTDTNYGTDNGTTSKSASELVSYAKGSSDSEYGVYKNGILAGLSNITLDESGIPDVMTAMAAENVSVSFTRSSLTAGAYSTVCLPFGFSKPDNCTFYQFAGVKLEGDNWVASFSDAGTSLTANTPYIFTCTATETTFSNQSFVAAASYTAGSKVSGDWTFKGTYSSISWSASIPEGTYGFTNAAGKSVGGSDLTAGTFVHLVQGASAAPFRAYLSYTGSNTNWKKVRTRTGTMEGEMPSVIIVRIVSSNGSTTEIGTLNTRTGELRTNSWYSLDGRRLLGEPTTKGVYIHNGKKVRR